MLTKRALLLMALALPLLAGALMPRAYAQGPAILIAETRLPQSASVKFPHVDTLDATVYVSGNADESVARLWAKADTAGSFGAPRLMGSAEGVPDYTSAAVFTAPDGTIHYAWINANARRILLRTKRLSDADFGPERIVVGSSPFPVEVEVAANEDGVFVFWREPDQPLKYRRSTDGINWGVPVQLLLTERVERYIDVAAAAGRRLAVGYTKGRENKLQSYAALWNGSAFVSERIPTVPDNDFAEPSLAFAPDGTLVAALRSTQSTDGFGAGVYISDRAPTGGWSAVGRLVKGETISVSLDVDALGNTHLFWISKASGGNDLWYTARRAGQGYGGGPLVVDTGALPIFNLRAAANLRDRSYGHAVSERFEGEDLFGQYFVFGLPVNNVSAASIAIEGGQQFTNKPAVSVAFNTLAGSPTEVRWRWGAVPTDAVNDSGGFKPLANPLTVAVPPLADPSACTSLTLYTQLKAGTVVQAGANSDEIIFDRAVQTQFIVASPNSGFDPNYTRVPTATLSLFNNLECSGLSAAVVSGPITGGSLVLDVVGKPALQASVGLTGDAGPKAITFTATDLLGNTTTVSRTVIYDPVPPVFTDAGPVVPLVPDPDGSTLLTITLSDVVASDNNKLYGLSVTPNVTPAGGAPIAGTPIIVPFSDVAVSTDPATGKLAIRATVDITNGLPASARVPGSYDLVIRLLDAAGNASLANTVRSVTLTEISYPLNLPLTRR